MNFEENFRGLNKGGGGSAAGEYFYMKKKILYIFGLNIC